jgi:subtilisin family serine protease
VAAGNDNHDACLNSPARVNEALTVAASTDTDRRASFSNYGRCIDIYAPGEDIISATNLNDYNSNILDGTSMSAPHVTGVAAMYLEFRPNASPSEVFSAIKLHSYKKMVIPDYGIIETTDLLHNFKIFTLHYEQKTFTAIADVVSWNGSVSSSLLWAEDRYSDIVVNLEAFCAQKGYTRGLNYTTTCGEDEDYYGSWNEATQQWEEVRSGSLNRCYTMFNTITCER